MGPLSVAASAERKSQLAGTAETSASERRNAPTSDAQRTQLHRLHAYTATRHPTHHLAPTSVIGSTAPGTFTHEIKAVVGQHEPGNDCHIVKGGQQLVFKIGCQLKVIHRPAAVTDEMMMMSG